MGTNLIEINGDSEAASVGSRWNINVTGDIDQAFDGAEVVYAKSGAARLLWRARERYRRTRTVSWVMGSWTSKDGSH